MQLQPLLNFEQPCVNTLQHTATVCVNTLQQAATHCTCSRSWILSSRLTFLRSCSSSCTSSCAVWLASKGTCVCAGICWWTYTSQKSASYPFHIYIYPTPEWAISHISTSHVIIYIWMSHVTHTPKAHSHGTWRSDLWKSASYPVHIQNFVAAWPLRNSHQLYEKSACYILCYGVATSSRLLKIIGLFCKRAL